MNSFVAPTLLYKLILRHHQIKYSYSFMTNDNTILLIFTSHTFAQYYCIGSCLVKITHANLFRLSEKNSNTSYHLRKIKKIPENKIKYYIAITLTTLLPTQIYGIVILPYSSTHPTSVVLFSPG